MKAIGMALYVGMVCVSYRRFVVVGQMLSSYGICIRIS